MERVPKTQLGNKFDARYIKDYDGGTFMECHIHPGMDYENISKILHDQKQVRIFG